MFAANSWIRASPRVPRRRQKRLEKQVFILLPAIWLPEDPPPTERWCFVRERWAHLLLRMNWEVGELEEERDLYLNPGSAH